MNQPVTQETNNNEPPNRQTNGSTNKLTRKLTNNHKTSPMNQQQQN